MGLLCIIKTRFNREYNKCDMINTAILHSFHYVYQPKAFTFSHNGLQLQQFSLHVTYQQFQANKTLV